MAKMAFLDIIMEVQRLKRNIYSLLEEDEPIPAARYDFVISDGLKPTIYSKNQARVKGIIEEPREISKEIHIRTGKRPSPPNNRKSRTGLSNEIKKVGAGRYNWGETVPKAIDDLESLRVDYVQASVLEPEIEKSDKKAKQTLDESIVTMSEYLGLEENADKSGSFLIDIVNIAKSTAERIIEIEQKVVDYLEKDEPPVFNENDFPILPLN